VAPAPTATKTATMAKSFFMLMYRHFSDVTRVTDVVEAWVITQW
jgi:hypothetical protein